MSRQVDFILEIIRQASVDYDLPFETVRQIYNKSNSLEDFYNQLEKYLDLLMEIYS